MKVVKPITFTDSMLTSSSVPETDYPEWDGVTTYALDAYCIMTSTHRIYKSLQAANTNNQPDTSPTWWEDTGPTNRWGMFDSKIGTVTSITGAISVVLTPGRIDSLGLLQLYADSLTVSMSSAGEEVYSQTINLNYGPSVADWYAYIFTPIKRRSDVVLRDLPPYSDSVLTIIIDGAGSTAACGMVVFGLISYLGGTQYGCTIGITDYSRKDTDEWGNPILTVRRFAKKLEAQLFLDNIEMDAVVDTLAGLRATPALWIGADDMYSSLIVYGFYRDFSVQIQYLNSSLCSLQIEGMI
jgi:hypothetical protein